MKVSCTRTSVINVISKWFFNTGTKLFQPLLWCLPMTVRGAVFFGLVASVLVPALAIQVPLKSNHRWLDEYSAILGDDDHIEWSLDKFPNPNATDHLVFETVHSLLQHWPNTRMRNGERSVLLSDFQ